MTSNILVVEDQAADAGLIRDLLADEHAIEVVGNGTTAISTLRAYSAEGSIPDLVLLDLRLPDISGFDILKFLREEPDFDDLVVVVLTNSDSDRDRQRALELGTDDYRTKPMDMDAFQCTITDIEQTFLDTTA